MFAMQGLTWTSPTDRALVSCHHQLSWFGPRATPGGRAGALSPALPDCPRSRCHVMPSRDTANPAHCPPLLSSIAKDGLQFWSSANGFQSLGRTSHLLLVGLSNKVCACSASMDVLISSILYILYNYIILYYIILYYIILYILYYIIFSLLHLQHPEVGSSNLPCSRDRLASNQRCFKPIQSNVSEYPSSYGREG